MQIKKRYYIAKTIDNNVAHFKYTFIIHISVELLPLGFIAVIVLRVMKDQHSSLS